MDSEQLQSEHYDRIAHLYETHYGDECSQNYRVKFFFEPMFEGIDLRGKRVLDAMCGSGESVSYLLSQGAEVTGLDISRREIDSFERRWPDCTAVCASMFDSGLESDSFDCVAVVGGLHHLHPKLNEAIHEIARILKPGGHFCFVEPHSGSIPDVIRQRWYKHDSLFADNEAAVDMRELKKEFAGKFDFIRESYSGNVAYLLVLNSLVFRIPLRWKPFYSPAAISLEALLNKLQGKLLSCFVVAQWQKK
jgi:SAM-dependent methyltransferase